ncbi:MAG: sensor histidine kinase [Myxococcales bacterium]
MISEEKAGAERKKTDESLRVEREKADDAIGGASTIDETADAVIERARAHADAVLANARAKSDRTSKATTGGVQRLDRQRTLEDQAVQQERDAADITLHEEREERETRLASEREKTDKDLSVERARSDDVIATRDEFLGIVSHDLRNMLGTVIGFADLIAKDALVDGHGQQILAHAQRIRRSGARMNRLVGDLVDVASIDAGKLGVTQAMGNVIPVVKEAVETFQPVATARGISLVAELVPPLPQVPFDSARLLQLLGNLLGNALKFTPRDGRIVVRVERHDKDIRFVVRDTGNGIPASQLEVIFERFHQVNDNDRRGLGLGLYISKSIVQGHGGKIWAESTIGAGSTFSFTLPLQLPSE